MLRTVQIGEKEVNLLANAATPIRYKMVFGDDIMVSFSQINSNKREKGEVLSITSQLAYIMSCQAKFDRKSLGNISKESYLDWLEEFGPMDFVDASEAIINTYLDTTKTTSTSKKEAGRPKGK